MTYQDLSLPGKCLQDRHQPSGRILSFRRRALSARQRSGTVSYTHLDVYKRQGVDIPILIKNPVNPDLELWIGAFERINNAGLKQLGAIHRGFSSYDKKIYRNLPQWHIPIELRRRIPELPIFCDPSHIGGKRELVAPLCQQAMDLGFDGLIVESHCNPDCAWSDAAQQVTPDVLDYILNLLVIRKETQTTENLGELRNQIDDCDNEIIEVLAKRMRVCREIGTFKKEHDMTILQTGRYNEILDTVSYTHLDVYKRQLLSIFILCVNIFKTQYLK